MTPYERTKIKVIFNKHREENRIRLFSKSNGETLYHEMKCLFVLSGVYRTKKGQLFLAADVESSETEDVGFCTPLEDIGFVRGGKSLTLNEVINYIERNKEDD